MTGMPPSGENIVGVDNWSTYPHLRWGFLHTREVVPVAPIERDASVRHVLDMRTGTAYDETYDNPDADVFLTEVLAGWRPPRGDVANVANVYEQIATLKNARAHGEVFDYRSILTDLLGWILERA